MKQLRWDHSNLPVYRETTGLYIKELKEYYTNFSISLDYAKKSFYRAFNAVFGKVGRVASENVVVELLKTKCLPILLCALGACPFTKTQLK